MADQTIVRVLTGVGDKPALCNSSVTHTLFVKLVPLFPVENYISASTMDLLFLFPAVLSVSPLSWPTSAALRVPQALVARCEHWTVELGPSPFLNPVPSSPPSCTFFPNPRPPQTSPWVLPVSPAPLVRRCLLPRCPAGEYPPALRTAATWGCPAPCLTRLWPISSQCLSPLWPSSSPSQPHVNPLWLPVCVSPTAGCPGHNQVQYFRGAATRVPPDVCWICLSLVTCLNEIIALTHFQFFS